MASTYTSRLRLTLQGDGDNAGTWGQVANTVFGLIDDSIGGVANIVATGSGEIDLTASVANGATDEARKAVLRFTGVPTANREVRIPSVEKIYFVDNAVSISSDSFYLLIHPDGTSAGVTVTPQERAILYCDGTNIYNMISNTSALDPSENLADLTNVSAALVNLGFTATIGELNVLDGITATVAELNVLDGITATVAELNILDGAIIDVTELNYLNGVTSSIQEQLDVLTSTIACVSSNVGNELIKTYTLSDDSSLTVGTTVLSSLYSEVEIQFEQVKVSTGGIAGSWYLWFFQDDASTTVSSVLESYTLVTDASSSEVFVAGSSEHAKLYNKNTTGDGYFTGTFKVRGHDLTDRPTMVQGEGFHFDPGNSGQGTARFSGGYCPFSYVSATPQIMFKGLRIASSIDTDWKMTGTVYCYGKRKGA